MASFRTLDDLSPKGRRVLVRVDLNVPMRDGEISDASRIERVAETLTSLADGGARVVVMSHFGRPRGRVTSSMSLRPLAGPLSRALGGRARRRTVGGLLVSMGVVGKEHDGQDQEDGQQRPNHLDWPGAEYTASRIGRHSHPQGSHDDSGLRSCDGPDNHPENQARHVRSLARL